ncbi:hypothetical protein [Anaeroplasma bactoclasticum]|jgi:hypothetical protein|nr:hypothetical protein [Anaeroplasma bactoclasticum]
MHSPIAHADTGNYSGSKSSKNGQLVLSTSGTWTSNASNGSLMQLYVTFH